MSTIAWDGITLAADKQGTFDRTPVPITKIFKIHDKLVGCSGDITSMIKFKNWAMDGFPNDERPSVEPMSAIVITKEKELIYYTSPHLIAIPLSIEKWTIGSGGDFALGAMHAGADAVNAVRIASQLDINSGMGVEWITL